MSKQLPLPLNQKPYFNTEAIAESIASDDMFDCYLEPVPGVGLITRRRPGLKLFSDLLTGKPGDGLFYWDAMDKVIAVSDGKVFDVQSDGTFIELSSAVTTISAADPNGYLDKSKDVNIVYLLDTDHAPDGLAHLITISSLFDLSNSEFLVTGIDNAGVLLTETIDGVNAATATSVGYFRRVTNITPTIKSQANIRDAGYLLNVTGLGPWGTFLAQPDDELGHLVTIFSTNDLSTVVFTVTGLDILGAVITEDITGPNAVMVKGGLEFASITKISTSFTIPPPPTLGPSVLNIGWTSDSFEALVTDATGTGPWTTFADQPPLGFSTRFYAESNINLSLIRLIVEGLDVDDKPQAETILTGPKPGYPVYGAKGFKSFTSITASATYGTNKVQFGWFGSDYYGSFDFGWSSSYLAPVAAIISGEPVVFADGQKLDGKPWLYMATGNLIYLTEDMILSAPIDLNTPEATHVAWINGRFIANESDTNRFDFTDTNPTTGNIENDYWGSTDNQLTCEARGDKLSALFTAFLEIYAWGTEGLEIWQDDGVTPFVPIQSAFTVAGIEGPYAYGKIDNTIFALCVIENKRCIIRLNSRSPQIISEPIARILGEMETVSDAFCDIISAGGLSIALWSFPTAEQSWAYDYKNDTWARWGYWNIANGEHERFIGNHSCFATTWNKHLIQSRVDGKIYEIDRNAFDDAGNIMLTYRRTGWIDRGTWNRKRSNQFIIKGKVYQHDSDTESTLQLRWRDNGNPNWCPLVEISLNPDSQGNFVVPMNRMGMYRSRQYEFRMSDNVDMVLVGAFEDVEVMRN